MAKKQTKTPSVYEKIFDSILKTIPKDASKVTRDMKQDPTTDDLGSQIKAREKSYTKLTEDFENNYNETHRQKRRLKGVFFWFIMPLYAIIILGSIAAIILSVVLPGNHIDIVLGSVASIITSIIAIPTIIAKYLFPTGEDQDMTTMINKMQIYDSGIRKMENGKQEKGLVKNTKNKEDEKDD